MPSLPNQGPQRREEPMGRGRGRGRGRVLLKGMGVGVGGLEPKSPKACVPKIAPKNISFGKFHVFPR